MYTYVCPLYIHCKKDADQHYTKTHRKHLRTISILCSSVFHFLGDHRACDFEPALATPNPLPARAKLLTLANVKFERATLQLPGRFRNVVFPSVFSKCVCEVCF